MKIITYIACLMLVHFTCFGDWQPSPSFVSYIKQVEGFRDKTYRCSAGKLTIGYGHNIEANRTAYTRLSESEATILLIKDLKATCGRIEAKYGRLNDRQREILTEYAFNLGIGGLAKFPKFTNAVLQNDLATQRKEFKRYAAGRELTGRNKAFYNRYLK